MPAIPSLGGLRGRGNSRAKGVPVRPIPVPLSAYVVDCAVYVGGKRVPGRWTHIEAIKEVRKRHEGFVWIGLHEPDADQIQGIAETFGLHELAVEDALEAHQRPKLERYDDTLFLVVKTVRYVEHESPTTANEIVETGELMVFLGRDFVITVRHGNHLGWPGRAVSWTTTPSGCSSARPRSCTRSPTTSSTTTSTSRAGSRTTST